MRFSILARQVLKQWEKLSLVAYPDQNDPPVWTIGYGHTSGVQKGLTWTEDQSERVLDSDINLFSAKVSILLIKSPQALTDNQFSALVLLAFNIGIFNFSQSTVLHLILVGNLSQVPSSFRLWNKVTIEGKKVVSNGLVNRREAEVSLWNTP